VRNFMKIASDSMRLVAAVLLVLILFRCASFGAQDTMRPVALEGALLIDGTGRPPIENSVLVIAGSKIVAAGKSGVIHIPNGADVIDVRGKTIMPALINLHSHLGLTVGTKLSGQSYTEENIRRQLERYLSYGVGTVLSLGLDEDSIYEIREAQHAGRFPGARVFTAGRGFGVEGGMPPAGSNRYRPDTPEEARTDVQELARLHPDFVKIWVDDSFGREPKMPPAIYRAIIDEAHLQHLHVIAHEAYLGDAKALVDAGVDGLAHSIQDQMVDNELISAMKARRVFLIPTLVFEEWHFVFGETETWLDDPFFRAGLDPQATAALTSPEFIAKIRANPINQEYRARLAMSKKNLKTLFDAGVKIGFGTDSGAPGPFLGQFEVYAKKNPETNGAASLRFLGYFEHRELQLMVDGGLTPMQAIVIATGTSAEILGAEKEFGTLSPGSQANFLVTNANPLENIRNTEKLSAVWQAGKRIAPITAERN
jgi:imidazolonepropionase-like amidohydrolase